MVEAKTQVYSKKGVDSLVDKDLQTIYSDELMEVAQLLDKVKNKPEKALSILKMLTKRDVPVELLKDSGIGKRLTAVSVEEEHYNGNEELLTKVKEVKEHLRKTWT